MPAPNTWLTRDPISQTNPGVSAEDVAEWTPQILLAVLEHGPVLGRIDFMKRKPKLTWAELDKLCDKLHNSNSTPGFFSLPCDPMTKKQVKRVTKLGMTYNGPTID